MRLTIGIVIRIIIDFVSLIFFVSKAVLRCSLTVRKFIKAHSIKKFQSVVLASNRGWSLHSSLILR